MAKETKTPEKNTDDNNGTVEAATKLKKDAEKLESAVNEMSQTADTGTNSNITESTKSESKSEGVKSKESKPERAIETITEVEDAKQDVEELEPATNEMPQAVNCGAFIPGQQVTCLPIRVYNTSVAATPSLVSMSKCVQIVDGTIHQGRVRVQITELHKLANCWVNVTDLIN